MLPSTSSPTNQNKITSNKFAVQDHSVSLLSTRQRSRIYCYDGLLLWRNHRRFYFFIKNYQQRIKLLTGAWFKKGAQVLLLKCTVHDVILVLNTEFLFTMFSRVWWNNQGRAHRSHPVSRLPCALWAQSALCVDHRGSTWQHHRVCITCSTCRFYPIPLSHSFLLTTLSALHGF